MARKPRIHYVGAIYHVIARGNNKDCIFIEPKDRQKYCELLQKYKQEYYFAIYAYALMDNHIHLLVRVQNAPLAKIMQGVQQSYTQYFNKKYQRVGHVFQQRYKAFLCKDDSYLLTLVCYIHQNPCRAGLAGGINYAWSSHSDYMAGQAHLADPQLVLKILGDSAQQGIVQYAEMVAQEHIKPAAMNEIIEAIKPSLTDHVEYEQRRETKVDTVLEHPLSFEELGKRIAEKWDVSLDALLGHCRVRKVVQARNVLIYQAVTEKLCTKAELANILSVDPARITRGYERAKDILTKVK